MSRAGVKADTHTEAAHGFSFLHRVSTSHARMDAAPASLFLVTDVVDADDVAAGILHRLVPGDVRGSENGHLAIKRLALLDLDYGFAGRVQNRTNRPSAAVGFRHAGGDANILLTTLYEKGGGHSFAILLADGVDNVEIAVDLCGTKIECRRILSAT